MKRVHLVISGDVVGVGFRAWALRYAQGKRITGWVKNREDGAVEVVAEGERKELELFIASCKHGPDVAWVESIDVTREEATGEFSEFAVVY